MKKIQVYDPPMCCSTGVCGTKVDEKLVEFAGVLKILSDSGVVVERYNMAQSPQAFIQNVKVKELLTGEGQNALPFIFVNGELKWSGKIPPAKELLKAFGIEYKTQAGDKGGCCGDSGCCS
ncbi:MAG: arsenite efflux transporter metallochaperone ArsD [Candidatus Omnitrophica bacterium]|nr:arsenite efflux transporter metallochaperone ArsD [Candidatus Omnitrophota bacterium]